MFFFFKQKTAYEMRISDWSSDVCSSDLDEGRHRDAQLEDHRLAAADGAEVAAAQDVADDQRLHNGGPAVAATLQDDGGHQHDRHRQRRPNRVYRTPYPQETGREDADIGDVVTSRLDP